jgi:hypothetical protein
MEATMTQSEAYQKKLFFIGALWNWGAVLLSLGVVFINKDLLTFFFKVPDSMLFCYIFWGAVFVFGLGYYWVSKDVERNRDLIKMGIIAKGMVFLLFFIYLIKGDITWLLFMGGCGDLVFAFLFKQVLDTLS